MSQQGVGLVWFRKDLRLHDNPAWDEATFVHERVMPLYVLDRNEVSQLGEHARDRLFGELAALDGALRDLGGRLRVVEGVGREAVIREVKALGASAVYLNHVVDPIARAQVAGLRSELRLPVVTSFGSLAVEPGTVQAKSGSAPRTFAAFHRAWLRAPLRGRPEAGSGRPTSVPGIPIPDSRAANECGNAAGLALVDEFLRGLRNYTSTRDDIAADGTSHLSEALAFGSISPLQVLDSVGGLPDSESFVRQLAWREWFAHQLWERPAGFVSPMNPLYEGMRWNADDLSLTAWQAGMTGFPLVDAGMRQLNQTGRMHNRVRMVAASFLVKHLLIDWRSGERYFRKMLVDADPSQNVGNWQWVAGTGFDSTPWFRIFNPIRQSKRHDPDGRYLRAWLPELAGLSSREIHEPWRLDRTGSDSLNGYPEPIVDLESARQEALFENHRLRESHRAAKPEMFSHLVLAGSEKGAS